MMKTSLLRLMFSQRIVRSIERMVSFLSGDGGGPILARNGGNRNHAKTIVR